MYWGEGVCKIRVPSEIQRVSKGSLQGDIGVHIGVYLDVWDEGVLQDSGYLLWGPQNKDQNILASILTPHSLWRLSCEH